MRHSTTASQNINVFAAHFEYGEWTTWSPCSKSCQTGSGNLEIQKRIRTCQPEPCNFGTVEERACLTPYCTPSKFLLYSVNLKSKSAHLFNQGHFLLLTLLPPSYMQAIISIQEDIQSIKSVFSSP